MAHSGGDAGGGAGSACEGVGGIRRISVPSLQVCCEPETALKKMKSVGEKKAAAF